LLTQLKEIAGALRYMMYSVDDRILV